MNILTRIASLFRKGPQRRPQDESNFDLERFDIRFCKKCGDPFQPINPVNKYCSKVCRIRFNNNKRK